MAMEKATADGKVIIMVSVISKPRVKVDHCLDLPGSIYPSF